MKDDMEQKDIEGKPSETQKLFEKLKGNKFSLHFNRVPEKTKESFLRLADEEFMGDRGMCLKFLMDDLIGQESKAVLIKLEEFEERLSALETTVIQQNTQEYKRRMANGRRLRKDEST